MLDELLLCCFLGHCMSRWRTSIWYQYEEKAEKQRGVSRTGIQIQTFRFSSNFWYNFFEVDQCGSITILNRGSARLDSRVFQDCSGGFILGSDGFVLQGLDSFFRVRSVFRVLDWSFRDWMQWSFKGLDGLVFSRVGVLFQGLDQNGFSTIFQDIEFYCFSAFSKNCLHIIVIARGCFITGKGH